MHKLDKMQFSFETGMILGWIYRRAKGVSALIKQSEPPVKAISKHIWYIKIIPLMR